jgi:serine/threonine protein phosphatase PrpC
VQENQDALCALTNFCGDTSTHFFGVFDGHGEKGAPCAQFAADKARPPARPSVRWLTGRAVSPRTLGRATAQCRAREEGAKTPLAAPTCSSAHPVPAAAGLRPRPD